MTKISRASVQSRTASASSSSTPTKLLQRVVGITMALALGGLLLMLGGSDLDLEEDYGLIAGGGGGNSIGGDPEDYEPILLANQKLRSATLGNATHEDDDPGAVRHWDPATHYRNPLDDEPLDPDRPFAYDAEEWRRKQPSRRIVLLAGPHKAGSTALQSFFVKFAGVTVSLERNLTGLALREFNPHYTNRSRFTHPTFDPHPAFVDWVWPTGIKEEFDQGFVAVGQYPFADIKFYAPLVSLLAERALEIFFYQWAGLYTDEQKHSYQKKVASFYRRILEVPWKEGHNIVIGTEELDVFVRGLGTTEDPVASRFRPRWEKTHADSSAARLIDRLIQVLPRHPDADAGAADGHANVKDDDLSHIEVQVSHRIPRIHHLASVWKQIAQTQADVGSGITMRNFLGNFREELYTTNGLGLALQFARKGIKVTLIVFDTSQTEAKSDILMYDQNEANRTQSVFGGFYGLVGCQILEMGAGVCDAHNKMHLDRYDGRLYMKSDLNKRDESRLSRDMSKPEQDTVEQYLRQYDCSVWKYLRRYQARGLVRVLNPPEGLFAECDYHAEDVSYYTALEKIHQYLIRERRAKLRHAKGA